jgi:hypothetical protein
VTTADYINFAIAVATALSVLISAAVAVVTYKTVLASRAAVEVMKAQLEATTRPYILVAPVVRSMSTFLFLRIVNTGGSSAKQLRLSIDKDFFFNAEDQPNNNLKTLAAFTNPIAEFAPQAELLLHLGVGHKIFSSDLTPLQFTVTARYEYAGRTVEEQTVVDLQPFKHSGKPIDAVAERLEQIRDELRKLASARQDGA